MQCDSYKVQWLTLLEPSIESSNVVLRFETVVEILKCDHSNESY